MAKIILISIGLIVIIVLLTIMAVREPTIITTPAEQPIIIEEKTPIAEEIERGEPTPVAPEITPLPAGVDIQKVYPQQLNFYVNDIRVPTSSTYAEGLNFIPIKEHDIKTFAGSFGPYFEDPTPELRVVMCAEYYKVVAAPACERVPILYRDNYVSFARGYQSDEYIGGMAAKDYVAYYDVYSGDTAIAHSNKAVIRTVRE